jgi:DNA-binding FadR family transcriptional regulator
MSGESIAAVWTLFERNIGSGAWSAGTKLPTERELERQFGIPRNKLRKVLKRLETEGKITRHVGRGSFVSDSSPGERSAAPSAPSPSSAAQSPPQPASPRPATASAGDVAGPSANLAGRIQGASPNDIMDIRMMVEPVAAELAAARATAADLQWIAHCHDQSKLATDGREFEYWDGQLHLAIIFAAKNDPLAGIYDAVTTARTQPAWERMNQRGASHARREKYQDHHGELVEALLERDAQRARKIALDHLISVHRSLFGG